MTNKLVVIVNSLTVPKIKKILLYEISCTKLQLHPEPLTRGLPPPDPRSPCPLSSTEFVEPPLPNKISGYATERDFRFSLQFPCSFQTNVKFSGHIYCR